MYQEKRYLEQFDRMKRWYDRVRKISEGKEHNLPTDYYQDEVYAFFINCYHLKDWIKNDAETHVASEEVEKFVNNSEFLKVCGDLCNGSKHLTIRNPKNSRDTHIDGRHFALHLGSGPIIHIEYDVVSGNKVYDAFSLASKCVQEWEEFFGP